MSGLTAFGLQRIQSDFITISSLLPRLSSSLEAIRRELPDGRRFGGYSWHTSSLPAPCLAFAFLIVSLGTQERGRGDYRLWAAASSTKAAPN